LLVSGGTGHGERVHWEHFMGAPMPTVLRLQLPTNFISRSLSRRLNRNFETCSKREPSQTRVVELKSPLSLAPRRDISHLARGVDVPNTNQFDPLCFLRETFFCSRRFRASRRSNLTMKHNSRREVNPSPRPESQFLLEDALSLRTRLERDARRRFLIEGVRAVNLAMEFDALETLFFCSNGDDGTRFLVAEARSYGARCHRVEEVELRAMASGEDAQNVVGIARQQLKSPEEAFAGEGVWLALESVNNDGNLGSMMRTAEAGGARGIVACGPDVDFWAPKAVRASMGAIFSQSLVRASWRDLLAFKNESNARWIGTALENARSYEQVEFGRNFWLWMGDERQGLSRRSLEACDELAFIPMQGRVDSLNVGVAAGVVLFGARRKS